MTTPMLSHLTGAITKGELGRARAGASEAPLDLTVSPFKPTKRCLQCDTPFEPKTKDGKFCSPRCSGKHSAEVRRDRRLTAPPATAVLAPVAVPANVPEPGRPGRPHQLELAQFVADLRAANPGVVIELRFGDIEMVVRP